MSQTTQAKEMIGPRTWVARAILLSIGWGLMGQAQAQQPFAPVADAFVRDGAAFQNTNYGANTSLITKKNVAGYNRWSYLKFELGIPGNNAITSAKLRLYGRVSSSTIASTPTAVYPVANTAWGESTITWNNKPTSGTTALATKTLTNAAAQYYEWDVTAYVQAEQISGRNLVSFALRNTASSTLVTVLDAKEAASGFAPQLVVTAPFAHFITRSGDRLLDGATPFKTIAVHATTAFYQLDRLYNEWEVPDTWEQHDLFRSLEQMGGLATRTYVLSVKKSDDGPRVIRHVTGPNQFDEATFQALDKALQLANQYGIRLILPFVDEHSHWGGIAEYAAFRGKTKTAFYTDSQLKADFKNTISYVLNRTNTYTGVQYKDDKAILAWQLGNELRSPNAWVSEMAAFIKSLDANHLVADGSYVRLQGIKPEVLNDPNIDLIDPHYYGYHSYDMVAKLNEHVALCQNKKPLLIGEFGMDSTATLNTLMDTLVASPGVVGGFLWNGRPHASNGGFYPKTEQVVDGVLYQAYHWPGFAQGDGYDETNVLASLRSHAYAIRGLPEPALPVPSAPTLLPISAVQTLSWQGAAGASGYDIERATSTAGPWTLVAADVSDAKETGPPLFADTSALASQSYYYRVKAKNASGTSTASNTVGPVDANTGVIVDNRDIGATYAGEWLLSTEHKDRAVADYRHDNHRDKGAKTATFTPSLPAAGLYNVYLWWPGHNNNTYASNVPVEIHYADGIAGGTINQRLNAGQWNLLGTYSFAAGTNGKVVITTTDTDGYVVADAVRFIPQ